MKTFLVAPNSPNNLSFVRRLPLVEPGAPGISCEGPGLFTVWVPSKLGGVLEVAASVPAEVVVRHPKPTSPALKDLAGAEIPRGHRFVYPVRPGEFGWFHVLVGKTTGPYSMNASFTEVGLAREANSDDAEPLVPWNFWYFPNAASRKEKTAWGSSTLQPCQKYERAFGKAGVLQWEKDNHNDPSGTAESWEGHCHNSAPAAIIFKTPPAAGKKHNGEDFLCEELKFFATEFFGGKGAMDFLWGLPGTGSMGRSGFYQENKPSDDPKRFGRQLGPFWNHLIEHLQKGREAVMMDLRDESGAEHSEVWNQAIYKYEAQMFETEPHGDWMDIQVKMTLRANADILPAGAVSSGSPAKIVASGPRAGGKPKDAVPDLAGHRRDVVLRGRVNFKANGSFYERHKRNEWSSVTTIDGSTDLHAPRFSFKAIRPTGNSEPDGNPLIESAHVLALLELRDRYK